MDWPGLVRRYVWDETRTPYLIGASRLTDAQARAELFVYALFVSLAGAVAATTSLAAGRSLVVSAYALSVVVAAVALGLQSRRAAALWVGSAPVAALAVTATELADGRMPAEKAAVAATVCLLWLCYARRILTIVRSMPGGSGQAALTFRTRARRARSPSG